MALVMAIGITMVLGISAASVAYYTSMQSRTAARGENRQDAYSLAEAGMNTALAVLNQSLHPNTGTALPSCPPTTSMSLEGGTATYCGVLNTSTYVWTLTATGTAPNPTGGTPITQTLHRTVALQGISDGASVSAWSRFYQDSPTQCLVLDTITIPGSVAAQNCMTLKNGAQITGATSQVDVGGDVDIQGTNTSTNKAAVTGAGWTNSGNIVSSNNIDATSVVAGSGSTANLDATNFGFSIPSTATILGVTAGIERSELTTPPPITYDTASSATSATAGTTLAWSHTVANQSNRVLLVGVTAEYSTSASCQANTVTYGAQSMTRIAQTVTGSGFECASLWYLLTPNVGTNTITVTYQNSITNRTAGAVGLYNVKQAAPDASNANFNNAGATTTNVTSLATNSWVVDVFGSGQALGNLNGGTNQTERVLVDSGSTESIGMSTKPLTTAGATSMTWTQTGINRSAAVSAVFAPAATPGELSDQDVLLLKGGSPVGTDKAGSANWTTSDTTITYGTSTDLWGTTLTPADVNASNFGVRLKVKNNSSTWSNTAQVDYVNVTVYYYPVPTASIGTSGTPIDHANISGTCTRGAQAGDSPCGPNDNVFAGQVGTAAQNLGKPTVDLNYWWANAAPGPKHPCTTKTGTPPVFDNNAGTTTGPDASVVDSGEITPENASYTCQVKDANNNVIGELSWDLPNRVLTVKGTIFRDGDFRFDDDGTIVHYKGRAIIYTPGHIEFDEQVCSGGTGPATCFNYPYPSSNGSTWDPTQNLLILLTGNTSTGLNNPASEYDQGGSTCSPSGTATCPNGLKPGGFQGIVYANGDCLIHQDFQLSGPVMCNNINIVNGQSGNGDNGQPDWPTFYTWPALGSLIDGQVYISTGSADDFQMTLGPTDG